MLSEYTKIFVWILTEFTQNILKITQEFWMTWQIMQSCFQSAKIESKSNSFSNLHNPFVQFIQNERIQLQNSRPFIWFQLNRMPRKWSMRWPNSVTGMWIAFVRVPNVSSTGPKIRKIILPKCALFLIFWCTQRLWVIISLLLLTLSARFKAVKARHVAVSFIRFFFPIIQRAF